MEAFGILLALLIGLVSAPVFCFALAMFVRPFPVLASFGFWMAAPIVVLFAVEVLLVITFGVLGTRALVCWCCRHLFSVQRRGHSLRDRWLWWAVPMAVVGRSGSQMKGEQERWACEKSPGFRVIEGSVVQSPSTVEGA